MKKLIEKVRERSPRRDSVTVQRRDVRMKWGLPQWLSDVGVGWDEDVIHVLWLKEGADVPMFYVEMMTN